MASTQGFTQAQLVELTAIVLAISFKADGVDQVKLDMGDHIDSHGLSTVWNVLLRLGRTDATFAAVDLKTDVLENVSTTYATNNDVINELLALKNSQVDNVSGLYGTTETAMFSSFEAMFVALKGVTPNTGCADLLDLATYLKSNSIAVDTTDRKASFAKVLAYFYYANASKSSSQTVGTYIRADTTITTSAVPEKRTASSVAGVTAAQTSAILKYKTAANTTQTPLSVDHLVDKAGFAWHILANSFNSFTGLTGSIKQSGAVSLQTLIENYTAPFRADTAGSTTAATSKYASVYTDAQATAARTNGYADNHGFFVIAKVLGFSLNDLYPLLYDMTADEIQGANGVHAFTGEVANKPLLQRLAVFSTVQKQPKTTALLFNDKAIDIYNAINDNTGAAGVSGKAFLPLVPVTVVTQPGVSAPSAENISKYTILQFIRSASGTNTTAGTLGAPVLNVPSMVTTSTTDPIVQLLGNVYVPNSTNTAVVSRVSTNYTLDADISGDSNIKKRILSILTNGNATTVLQLLISGTTSGTDDAAISLLLTLLDGNEFNDVLNLASGDHSNGKSFVTLYLQHIISSTTDVKDKFTKITGFSNSKLALAQAGFSGLDENSSTVYTKRIALIKKFVLSNLSSMSTLVSALHNMSGATDAIRLNVLGAVMASSDNDLVSGFKPMMKNYTFAALADKMGVPKAPKDSTLDADVKLSSETTALNTWFTAFNGEDDIQKFKDYGTSPLVLVPWVRSSTFVSTSTGAYSYSPSARSPVFPLLKIKSVYGLSDAELADILVSAGLTPTA